MHTERIHDEFPAPSYRGHQEDALDRIAAAFDDGNDVVLVRAPTGSGKSLLARAICGTAKTHDDTDHASEAVGSYYTTPQVSQLDDVSDDDLLEDFAIIRGKSNYDCILPEERDTPVDQAPCARKAGYDCSVKDRCPYFASRNLAANRQIAAMTLAYFMQTAGSEVFRKRDVCVIDEAHGLAEWAEMYATIDLGPYTVPVWDDLSVPNLDEQDAGPVEAAFHFAETAIAACEHRKDALLGQAELSASEVAERDRLQERIGDLQWFREDYRDTDSATEWLIDQAENRAITIKPLEPERYLHHTVWDRANRFALLSATILDKEAFCRQVGLDPANVAMVDLPHTFPLEHRRLYDVTCGRMTTEHRDATLPRMAETIARLMDEHDDEKGLVHCHSYAIQDRLAELLRDRGKDARLWTHDSEDRDGTLVAWKRSDGPGVLLSVKMEEALDLEGDLARWQVLCKAPFPNAGDARVAHRLEQDRWAWYYRTTLRTVIQGCGRVVRSPDDYGATYVADDALLDVFERAGSVMPDWFREQVDEMRAPDIPGLPVEASGSAAAVAAGGDATGTSDGRDAGTATANASTKSGSGSAAGSSTDGAADAATADTGQTDSSDDDGDDSRSAKGSPLGDVWGDG
ncbi:DNA helicase, Rad3 [Salinarchaeum sp. Harcht-Bsk1]|uniref:helicase C-terminal domain-containing protein n=1 Tax=Salinarchaeum sp. Harcht-Bsk1 TaxID=1333523 RepID=UPI0003423AF3|nr:ATP-dependent DNA helicase [Salinarchaeum sp. Harcht-Bsk1]AGN01921.1 DNA helicase, Rad3 [Salinarchaeum sp. Harcht-Bsk1]